MMRSIALVSVVIGVVVAGCGKSAPATPTPSVSSLALSPATDYLKLKATEKFSATATYTNGAAETVNASWSSDNQAVATVDASGSVTGVGAGQATITATYQGKAATRSLRVIPDYSGNWSGSYATTSCQVSGDFRQDWCLGVQGSFPATLNLIQSRDYVSGTWTLQEATGTVQGTVAANGVLPLTGSSFQGGVRIEITSWQSTTTDNRTMTGSFTLRWTAEGRTGSAETRVDMRNFAKQ
jgi:hypothetical protein